MTKSWQNTVEFAKKLAADGLHDDGLSHLMSNLDNPPKDSQLASIFWYGSTFAKFNETAVLAKIYANRSQTESHPNKLTNAWALELLRKANQSEDLLNLVDNLSLTEMDHSLFHLHLANSMNDEEVLIKNADNQNLLSAFKKSVEQANIENKEEESAFICQCCEVFGRAPKTYKALIERQRTLFALIDKDLSNGRNATLTRLLFGQNLSSRRFVEALNQSSPKELNIIFKQNMQYFDKYIDLLNSPRDEFIDLAPKLILFLEKMRMIKENKNLDNLIEDWLERLPNSYSKNPENFPLEVLDQLVVLNRKNAPHIFDWYLSLRKDREEFENLALPTLPDKIVNSATLLRQRKPRIAVCISGQLRGYKEAFKTLKNRLFPDIETIFFIDTWQKIGRKKVHPIHAYRTFTGNFKNSFEIVGNQLGIETMMASYPSIMKLDDTSIATPEEISDHYGCAIENVRIESETSAKFDKFTNAQKMYYKILGAHDLFDKSGIEVDAVLRIRPDKNILKVHANFDWFNLIDKSQKNDTIFVDLPISLHPVMGLVVGDQVGFATKSLMEIYASALTFTSKASHLDWFDWPSFARPHLNISHALWINRVRALTLPIEWGKNFDPARLDAKDTFKLLKKDLNGRKLTHHDEILLCAAKADLSN